jgi:hypothetical protein
LQRNKKFEHLQYFHLAVILNNNQNVENQKEAQLYLHDMYLMLLLLLVLDLMHFYGMQVCHLLLK